MTFAVKILDPCLLNTSHAMLSFTSYWPPVVIALLSLIGWFLATCDWLSFRNESSLLSVIGFTASMSHTSLTVLCYRPEGYVFIQRSMLLSTGLCYRPQGYDIVQMAILSSTGLCYRTRATDRWVKIFSVICLYFAKK